MSVSLNARGPVAAVVVIVSAVTALLAGVVVPVPLAGATACANEQFRIGPSAGLPDCRAYEMVSPANKNGGQVDNGLHFWGPYINQEQAAPDGEAITYGSTSAFFESEAKSALVVSQYISTRTPGGWVTREVTPTQRVPKGRTSTSPGTPEYSLFQGFTENLEFGYLSAWNPQPDPSAPSGFFNPYLRNDRTGEYQLLSSVVPPAHSPSEEVGQFGGFLTVYAGASTDGRHVIFEANDGLTPEAAAGQNELYEWSADRGLELINSPQETSGGHEFGSPIAGPASLFDGKGFGGGFGGFPYNFSGALSSDGGRAFWTGSDNQVYMHELMGSGSRTVEVSASQKSGEPSGGEPAQYWTANKEGSLVYFTSSEQLTEGSTAGPGQNPKERGQDLYQYNTETGELSDLTVDTRPGENADVKGVLGIGEPEGGSPYVYFMAGGVLAENTNSDGAKATTQTCQQPTYFNSYEQNAPCNLYVFHEGHTVYIATLEREQVFVPAGHYYTGFEPEVSDWTESVMARTSRVSSDGVMLAFQSELPLTGYDSMPAQGGRCPRPVLEGLGLSQYENTACMEVFEYDAQAGRLVCASCDPDGLAPTANAMVPETYHEGENVEGWESSTVQQRYLLDDGRLFFQSEGELLPQATNGKFNVYEYEPEGVGQCAASGAGSCLSLISTGGSSGSSYFADASSDGRDVFILSKQQLVAQDGDEGFDVYDAREGGGFVSETPPPCLGEACKPALTPAPAIYGAPSSATFEGAGDIEAPPVATPQKPAKARAKAKAKTKKKSRKRAGKDKKKRGRVARRALARRDRSGR
jgi:hypothetical protein